ncbi:MAG: hypothetical protein AUH15_04335 [Acidobacteriales bacterium 13_2_20CM_55_8]|nr:MAG: hypothetical protein AUH15_04335 [Acidobacteriales bacterium 13_2_20CM_55_8]
MIDLIRASAVPSNLMQAAARGALAVPPGEMIEILVHLAIHNKVFGEQAKLTLAGWDEVSSRGAASDPNTSKEVLEYFVSAENLRPALLPALLENPSLAEGTLVQGAGSASREVVESMLKSRRVNQSEKILSSLSSNPNLTGIETTNIKNKLAAGIVILANSPPEEARVEDDDVMPEMPADEPAGAEDVLDEALMAYFAEHEKEISANEDKPFQPIGSFYEDFAPGSEEPLAADPEVPIAAPPATEPAPAAPATKTAAATGVKKAAVAKKSQGLDEGRGSALQKISKLDVKGRIQLAMKGNKEERSILVRDGTKVVALAVLDSPKVTDSEVEKFASQRNVLESVLRGIPLKRRFMKHYAIVRNLAFNPRTPIDVSITLVKNLLVQDLKNLSGNKEVSETVRKAALRLFKQKLDSTKRD